MFIESPESLRVWLTSTLEPICDADPAALAKYVMALLKKDRAVNELKEFCVDQLDVFLQKETKDFVETLFDAVQSKCYLPGNAGGNSSAAAPALHPSNNSNSHSNKQSTPVVVSPAKVDRTSPAGQSAIVEPDHVTTNAAASTNGAIKSEAGDAKSESTNATGGDKGAPSGGGNSSRNSSARKRVSPPKRDSRERDKDKEKGGREDKHSREGRGGGERRERRGSRSRSPQRERDRRRGRDAGKSEPENAGSGRSARDARNRIQHNRDRSRDNRESKEFSSGRRRPVSKSRSPVRRTRKGSRDGSPVASKSKSETVKKEDSSSSKENSGAETSPPSVKEPPRKKKTRCRDYDEKGYCMRGDHCPFDHGPDPVVVDDTALPSMIAMGPATKTGGPVTAPPPNFSVPPPGYAPLNPPPPGVDPVVYTPATTKAGGPKVTTEGYNPESPSLSMAGPMGTMTTAHGVIQAPGTTQAAYSVPPPSMPVVTGVWNHPPPATIPPYGFTARPPPMVGQKRELITLAEGSGYQEAASGQMGHNYGAPFAKRGRGGIMDRLGPRPGMQGGYGMRPRYPVGGMGQHGGPRPQMMPDNKTLEVRKIPPHMNNIAKLNEHFQKFGQITNIQVRYEGDPEAALITYQTKNQATAAYKSTAPILNNRFIKVFWHTAKELGPGGSDQQQSQPGQDSTQGDNKGGVNVRDRLGQPGSFQAGSAGEVENTSLVERKDNDGVQKSVMINAKGSLTKTLYNPGALAAARTHGLPRAAVAPLGPPAHIARQREYYAAKKQRRQEKEQKIALLQLQAKKNSLLTKQLDQQKLLVVQLEKVKDEKQKKELMKMMKSMKNSSTQLFAEVKELNAKLSEMSRATVERDSKTKEEVEKEKLDLELELMNQSQAGEDTRDLHKRLTDIKQQLILLAKKGEAEGRSAVGPLATSTPIQSSSSSDMRKNKNMIPQNSRLDKRPKNITVEGFGPEEKDAIIQHLREFGEMVDLEFDSKGKDGGCRALVIYKTRQDAERAVQMCPKFKDDRRLTVNWGVQVKGEQMGAEEPSEGGGGGPSDAPGVVGGPKGGTAGTEGADLDTSGEKRRHRMSASELLASLGDDSDDSDQGQDDPVEEEEEEEDEDPEDGGRRGRR